MGMMWEEESWESHSTYWVTRIPTAHQDYRISNGLEKELSIQSSMLVELEGPADIGQLVQGLEMENLFFSAYWDGVAYQPDLVFLLNDT